jgi:hypothetical protein
MPYPYLYCSESHFFKLNSSLQEGQMLVANLESERRAVGTDYTCIDSTILLHFHRNRISISRQTLYKLKGQKA